MSGTIIVLLFVLLSLEDSSDYIGHESYKDEITVEYDPASQTNITILPVTNGVDENEIRFVGMEKVIDLGVPLWHWTVFQSVVEEYAKKNEIDLFRVSYLKDSFKLVRSYVFDFKVVFNIDQQTISARIDASENRLDIMGSIYVLSDESGKELYRFVVDETNICRFDGSCVEE